MSLIAVSVEQSIDLPFGRQVLTFADSADNATPRGRQRYRWCTLAIGESHTSRSISAGALMIFFNLS